MQIKILRHDHIHQSISILFLVFIGGCGGVDAGPAIHPVSGKILVNGKPAAKAQVTFHRSDGPANYPTPFAEADADGAFRPTTKLSNDGAPAGDYTLTVIWPEFRIDHGEEIAGQDRLRGFYGSPAISKLRVTINEGENALPPFDLSSSGQSTARVTGSEGRGR